MVIVPKEKPAIKNLNSYYLDIRKLFEHYQGEFGAGCIHFKSSSAEAVVFFDKDEILTGVFQDKDGELEGEAAIEGIINAAGKYNFDVNVYNIDADKIYFWANMPYAEVIYKDLSTEFTDLGGLIKKMAAEKLTGCIDVFMAQGHEGGVIFFNNGKIAGGSYDLGSEEISPSKTSQEVLIQKTKEQGGICNVHRISIGHRKAESDGTHTNEKPSSNVLTILQDLLSTLERVIASNKKIKADFHTLLKKKFLEKADKYEFLDPFTAELVYADQKLLFVGVASDHDLAKAITESVKELAGQLGMMPQLREMLGPWSRKYEREIAKLDIKL
ncbi:MAG: hypothetical protein PVG99_05040 [Desulfobacteraceae bacterium]|jgi:hypothetical protein